MYLSKLLNSKLKFLAYFLIFFLFFSKLGAETIKPNNGIEPFQVVKIQLRGLMNNDNPKMDHGIEQTWEFAHPKNKKFTGPLDNFKLMLKGNLYSMLLNHKDHKVIEVFLSDEIATFEVTVFFITLIPIVSLTSSTEAVSVIFPVFFPTKLP